MGRPVSFFCEEEELDPAVMQSLERVRRGPGLEGTAPQQPCPAGFYRLRHPDDLLLVFDGAGAGRNRKMPAADFHGFPSRALDADDGVLRMEFPVGRLVRLGDPFDVLDRVVCEHAVDIHPGGIPDDTDDGGALPGADVMRQPFGGKAVEQALHLIRFRVGFENDDHLDFLLPFHR